MRDDLDGPRRPDIVVESGSISESGVSSLNKKKNMARGNSDFGSSVAPEKIFDLDENPE